MVTSSKAMLFLWLLTACQFSWSADALTETQSLIQEWVQTEQLISKENRTWQLEKSSIENILKILNAEQRELNAQISQAQEIASKADEERAALVDQLATYQNVSELIQNQFVDYERQLLLIAAYLPPILKNELGQRIARLDSTPQGASLSLSERAQTLLSILSEINAFDTRMTLTTELIDNADRSIEVQVLYFGLSRAFFVNENGSIAGVGVPEDGGWRWQQIANLAPSVRRAIDIHETRMSPQFISLPMGLQQ